MINDKKLQDIIKWYPHGGGQDEVLKCKNKEVMICAGRGWGKSILMAYIVLKELLGRVKTGECKIFIIAPTYNLTSKVFEHFTKLLLAWDKRWAQYISGGGNRPYQFKMSANIWIQCWSTTEPSGMLGERVNLLVVDEAAMIPEKIYLQNLQPLIIPVDSRAYYISTPRGEGWFKKKFYLLKDKLSAFQYKSIDGVITTEEQLEEQKKEWPDLLFRQEYLAEFVSDVGTVFRKEVLEKIQLPNIFQDSIVGHYYTMGVDIAKEEDYTVITIIDTTTNNVVHRDRFKGWDFPFQKKHIIAKAERYNGARVILDTTGLGAPIYEDLRKAGVFVEDFTFSGKSKEELFFKGRIYIENGYINIPTEQEYPELWDELLNFEYKYINDKTGEPLKNVQYGPPKSYHDDCVDSLALAIWGMNYSKPKPLNKFKEKLKEKQKARQTIKSDI